MTKIILSNRISIAPISYISSIVDGVVTFKHGNDWIKRIALDVRFSEKGDTGDFGLLVQQSLTAVVHADSSFLRQISTPCVVSVSTSGGSNHIIGTIDNPFEIPDISKEINPCKIQFNRVSFDYELI